jgi:catechol 2,3-dioxygenase-like lactoylglutathione lyase family enzyme
MTVSPAFEYVAPVLPARDVSKALSFYVDRLGFEVFSQDRPDRPEYAGVRRGGVVLHLQFQFERDFRAGKAGQAMLRILVDDPDALFAEYRAPTFPIWVRRWSTRTGVPASLASSTQMAMP